MEHLHRNNLYDLKDRVCLVTGGATGIGQMITKAFIQNGAKKVYICGRRGEKLQDAARSLAGHIVPIEMDVADKDTIRKAVKQVEQEEGKLDVLVNNAGITGPTSPFFNQEGSPENKSPAALGTALFENEKVEDWQGLYGNNVAPIFFVTTAFLGLLAKASEERGPWSACVINISSVSGQIRISQAKFAYNSSKAAIIQLTKMFATEFALKNIQVRVNSIAPGTYPSEMTGFQGEQEVGKKDVNEAAQGLHETPAGRSGKDVDMAALALLLASEGGYYIHGQIITTDGGLGAVHP
ncbi:hypothetical protein OPQ81_001290 [Rhizoctonia solani]|nr:hypothetical protein OPQ81_001290 [Rhizoctonia solani]